MVSSTPANRCLTAGLWMRVDVTRLSTAARLAASSLGHRGGPWFTARVRTATSWSFCLAKAIQPFNSASSAGSSSRSIGQCSREHEGATMIRSGPSLVAALSNRPSVCSRSFRHTLRPSITPSESIMPCGVRFQSAVQLIGGTDQIEMHGGHRQPQRRRQVVAQIAKIGRQANPDLLRRRARAARRPTPRRASLPWANREPAPARRPAPSRPRHGRAARAPLRRRAISCRAARAACSFGPRHLPKQQKRQTAPAAPAGCGCPGPPPRGTGRPGLVDASLNFIPVSNSGTM